MPTRAGNILLLVSLVIASSVRVLWPRSYTRGDGVFLFGGRAGPGGPRRRRLVLCVSNVNVGPDRAFTAQGVSTEAGELTGTWDELVEADAAQRSHWASMPASPKPARSACPSACTP